MSLNVLLDMSGTAKCLVLGSGEPQYSSSLIGNLWQYNVHEPAIGFASAVHRTFVGIIGQVFPARSRDSHLFSEPPAHLCA